ncbi:MAG: hypothetical protein LBI60_01365, partial [Bacteroidales bacterium]|nr:hypothetical protein [Bacteroidales bacterium]
EKEKIEKEEEKITEAITNPELLPHIMRHRIQRVIFNDGRYYYLSEFLVYLNMHELQDIGMQYFDGVKLSQTGIGLLIGGTVATLGGGMLINLFPRSLSFVNLIMGSILVTVGGSLVIASIPCLIIGNVKRNAAINKYNGNSKVQYTYQPNIYLGLTGNGFTVNLNF